MKFLLRPRLLVFAVLLLVPAATASAGLEPFFSEYVEGTANNQALEIYNATGYPVNLAGYQIEIYLNGASTPSATMPFMSATVPNGGTYVVVNAQASVALMGHANWPWAGLTFDGNDTVVLRKIADSTIVDAIGQIGYDPGTGWGSGMTSTRDHTLARKINVCNGRRDAYGTFDPSLEWDGYAVDTFSNLGSHTSNCQPVGVEFDAETWGAVKDYFR